MAKNYNDIYTAVYTKGNKMDFGNSMIRGNAIPLDITAVYNSYSAAQAYVNSNPVAYEGQVLAVTENNDTVVYVIAARLAADGTTVEHYLKEVGKTPEVDNVTIKLVDGKLTAVIPEYEDTDTQYTLSVLADGKIAFASDIDGEEATEIRFIGAQGIEVTSDAKTGVIVIAGPDLTEYVQKTELSNYAEKSSVYTQEQIDTKLKPFATEAFVTSTVGEAIATVPHLRRVILPAPGTNETPEELIVNWISTNQQETWAEQYVYMIPTGLQESDNKYREYLAFRQDDGSYQVEQVGNWEVDLKDYLTIASANETYAKKNDIAETYATKDEVNTTLEDYDTAEEIAEVYATKAEVEEEFKSYSTTEEIANEYVSNGELETALEPYAKKTDLPTDYVSDAEFEEAMKAYDTAEVSKGKYADKGETELALGNRYTKEETNSLLAGKVDNSTATAEDGIRFINQVEISKLSKLNLEGDDITISGSVNASQVKELYPTVINIIKGSASDLDPDTEGNQLGLGIEEGAQVNFINKVDTNIFSVDENKQLNLVKVPVGNLEGLSGWITDNRDTVEGLYPTEAKNLLEALDDAINNETTGLIVGLAAVEARVLANETAIEEHADKIEALEYAMTWHEIEVNQTV